MVGLVLEGGASRTLFSCGVLDSFLDNNIIADYVIGASAGISYGVSYCSRQRGRNLGITINFMNDKRYMGWRHLANRRNRSYYNLDFVFDEIPNQLLPFNLHKFQQFEGSVIGVVTNIVTGQPEYIEISRTDRSYTVLRASCALPLLFKPIKINCGYYLDGGVSDSIPFRKALADGCNKIIVILTRERGFVKTPEKASRAVEFVYGKDYPEFVKTALSRHTRYNNDLKELSQLEAQGKAFVIAPESTHGIRRTESSTKILVPFYEEGVSHGEKIMPQLKKFLQ